LEDVSSQAARIRQAADASSALPDGDPAALESSDKLDELRSVVSYLRKEKEIVDLQLELAKQENTRLKAQVEHLSQTLAETKENLTQVCSSITPAFSQS
jgi:nucleoprotein TPR